MDTTLAYWDSAWPDNMKSLQTFAKSLQTFDKNPARVPQACGKYSRQINGKHDSMFLDALLKIKISENLLSLPTNFIY